MELWTLRLVHITTSILWGGWTAMIGFFVLPAVADAGPAGGAVMAGVMKRRLPLWMNALGLLSVLSGVRLYMLNASREWLTTGPGLTLTMGAALALIAFSVGHAVSRPTAARLSALQQTLQGPPSAEQAAELQRLGARAVSAGRLNAWCSVGAALCMGASRFFPG